MLVERLAKRRRVVSTEQDADKATAAATMEDVDFIFEQNKEREKRQRIYRKYEVMETSGSDAQPERVTVELTK